MYLLIVILPLIGSSVAGFFGRFLGSEGSAIMTTAGRNLVLCGGIVLLFFSTLLGLYRLSLIKLYGKGIFLLIHASLFFLIAMYHSYIRFYTMSLCSFFLLGLAVSNEGGVICSMVSGNGAPENSGWTSILGQQGDGSVSSVNQPTPTNSTHTGSASEPGENVIPPSPVLLQQKKEEFFSFVLQQFVHYLNRNLKPWQRNTSEEGIELYRVCVRHIIQSLEIEDSVSEYERWKTHLQTNPTTLHTLFKEYK